MGLAEKYNEWHARYTATDDSAELHSWHFAVQRNLDVEPHARILEIGCGTGDFSAVLASRFPESKIVGIDFSATAVSVARERCGTTHPNLTFYVGDAASLPLRSTSFDVVISCECIEHVIEPHRMAEEVARLLSPGGRFYITTENYFNGMILMWAKSLVTGVPIATGTGTQPHENFFLYWRVKRMLEAAGLVVQHMESDYFQWLMLPRVSPSTLATVDFRNRHLKRFFRPIGRHFLFAGTVGPTVAAKLDVDG